jgi:hypothetical protein
LYELRFLNLDSPATAEKESLTKEWTSTSSQHPFQHPKQQSIKELLRKPMPCRGEGQCVESRSARIHFLFARVASEDISVAYSSTGGNFHD